MRRDFVQGEELLQIMVSLYGEIILAFWGLLLYAGYSIVYTTNRDNQLLNHRLPLNLAYIIVAIALVVAGFLVRACEEKEGEV